MPKPFDAFGRDRRGNVALVFALALPVIGGAVAAAVDLSTWYAARDRLQLAVDGSALAAAREFQLATATAGTVAQAAEAHLRSYLASRGPTPTTVTARGDKALRSVKVDVTAEVSPILSRLITDKIQFVSATATAKLSNAAPVCVIGLDPSQPGTLSFKSNSLLTAERCAVYSNSSHSRGLEGGSGAKASSALFCSHGGFGGAKARFSPAPVTDCPTVKDPLAGRPNPSVGPCLAHDLVVSKAVTVLPPGTYCGGLRITDKATVKLLPGTFVFKDGPLLVNKKSVIQGANVSLYFAGDKASLLFDKDSTVSLSAPKDGPMAGILLSEERAVVKPEPAPLPTDLLEAIVGGVAGVLGAAPPPLPAGAPPMREYRIVSDNARELIGTIYLPSGRLMIDSKRSVADQSAYTVIVARRLELFDGPNLYLNSNYSASDVPVPKGVGPVGGDIALTR